MSTPTTQQPIINSNSPLSPRPTVFIDTTAVKQAVLAANMAMRLGGPAAIIGPPGVGKTTGAEEAARRCGHKFVYATLLSDYSVKASISLLFTAATGTTARGTTSALISELVAYLTDRPTLIIIDDADFLRPQSTQSLVSIHNALHQRTGRGQPMVLVANSLDHVFAQAPNLESRLKSRQRVEKLSFDEVKGFLPTISPLFAKPNLENLRELNGTRYFNGDIRRWLTFAETVAMFGSKAKVLTPTLVKEALAAMETGS